MPTYPYLVDATVIVRYDQTDIGPLYLGDVGMRNQLGGGRGLYVLGQDRYMHYGDDATFVKTGDVLLSINQGRIGAGIDASAFSIQF
jgi:hypothetical protein